MLELPISLVGWMITLAKLNDPIECCGIIGGKDGVAKKFYEVPNADKSEHTYRMAEDDLLKVYHDLDAEDLDVLVVYHSHPASEAYPSSQDVKLASWPDAHYVIISLSRQPADVKSFVIQDGVAEEEDLVISVSSGTPMPVPPSGSVSQLVLPPYLRNR